MIVKIVSEGVDQIDSVVPGLLVGMSWEEHKSDVSDVITDSCSWQILEFQWGLSKGVEHCGRRLTGFSAFAELLEENFSDDHIVNVFEDGAEDDSDPIGLRFNIHRFVFTVVYHSSLLGLLTRFLGFKVLLEDRREAVSLQCRRRLDKFRGICWQGVQVELKGHVETGFW